MSLENGILKAIRTDLSSLEDKLNTLSSKLVENETYTGREEYVTLLLEYDELAQRKINYLHKEQAARRYNEGSRPGRYLARLVRQLKSPPTITQIRDKDGQILKDSNSINLAFKNYYEAVYSDTEPILEENAVEYLEDIRLAWASDTDRKILNVPLSTEEIEIAIADLQTGKTPDPDGLGAEFYKAHKSFLAPYLRDISAEAFETGTLPDTMQDALIISLLKLYRAA